MGVVRKYSIKEAEEIIEKFDYQLVNQEYELNSYKLTLQDKEGYYYSTRLTTLERFGKTRRFGKHNQYTIYNIKLWCKLNNKSFELIDDQIYNGNTLKLKWQCFKEGCQEIFEACWGDIYSGRGCGYCKGIQVGMSNCLATKNPKLASEWHPTKNGDLTPWNVTANSGKKVWWRCSQNPKHEWEREIINRNSKEYGCPYCSKRYSTEDYNLLVMNPILCEEWNYEKNKKRPEEYCPNSGKKVWWKCSEGHEWNSVIASRNSNGNGCPECNESKGEKKIKEILIKHSVPFDFEYTFDGLLGLGGGFLRFDVAVFVDQDKTQLKLVVEYDGIFHYEKQYDDDGFKTIQEHDNRKNEYCLKNNIALIRIPYWEFDNIESILESILIHNNWDSKFIVK